MTSGTNEASPLIALFEREGYARVEPPILQPT
jgi:ATP phosphoribosyltransferase regulatory subunit HisZ